MAGTRNITNSNWEATGKPKLLSLHPYRSLFPKATGVDKTVKRNAGVSHTVAFIPKVVHDCSWQVKQFVEKELKHLNLEQACRKLWEFVRFHIEWVKDETGLEQVRSPRRLIFDGKGDCDCMTTFVDTCMYVYGVKGITNRIVAFDGNKNYSHIYSIIHDGKGGQYIIDCCIHTFNYEKPFSKKEDYTMDLQFLDGIEDNTESPRKGIDTNDLFGAENIMGELGKLLNRQADRKNKGGLFTKRTQEQKQKAHDKRVNAGKKAIKVVNTVNKVNPATILLRAGILASMKLNVLKVAERIKWGYASYELAQSKGMDMSKYNKVKDILTKAEKIFYAAGGKPENLKHSILTGKGNVNKELSGLGELTEQTALPQILDGVYNDEFVQGMEGIEGLGEPTTAASLTAASGVMGALAALLASLGTLFPKNGKQPTKKSTRKSKQQAPATENENTTESDTNENNNTEETSTETDDSENQSATTEETNITTDDNNDSETTEETSENSEESTNGFGGVLEGITDFYQKNKNWINPVAGFTAGVLTTLLMKEFLSSKPDKKQKHHKGLQGTEDSPIKREEDDLGEQAEIALM